MELQPVISVLIIVLFPLIAKQVCWFWFAPSEFCNKDWHRQGDQFPLRIFQSTL